MNPQPPDPKTLFPSLPVGASADPARPLRICIASFDLVGPVRNGGVGTAFTSLGEALAEAGHEVTFLYLSGQFCENGKLEDWISHYQKKAIRFVPMPSQTEPRIEAPFHMARAYEAYLWLRGQEFDIIHFSEWRAPGYYTLLARHQGLAFENTRMCVHTHGPTLWSRLSNSEYVTQIEDLELDDMERFSVKMADVTVSPSQYLFHWMEQQGWQLPQNRFVQQYVQPASARPAQTASADARRQVRELVFFGRLEVRKGLLLFCDALDRLKDDPQARGLKITFLGKVTKVNGREAADYLKDRAQRWPWQWQIISNLDQPRAIKHLEKDSVLAVMPSLVDNLPNTVLECLGAKVPFLTSEIGGIPEMIAPEDFERTCFPLRAGHFAEKIKRVLREGSRPVKPAVDPEATRGAWLDWHAGLKVSAGATVSSLSLQLTQSQPLVSVCMSHFNRPDYLRQALASIEAQDYPNFEVVLVDDCSAKPEAVAYIDSLVPQFGERGWQLIRNKDEVFVGAARNQAARQARGEYLLFMDDDNFAKPHEISTFIKVAQKTGADILSCFLDFFSGQEAPKPGQFPNFQFLFLGNAPSASALSNYLGDTNSLIRRTVFLQLGGFHEERGVGHEDWELFGDAVLKGYHVEVVPESLVWYRRNETELSATRTNSLHAGHMRNIRPYLDAVPPVLRNLVLFAQGQIMRLNDAASVTAVGPNAQDTIRWRSLLEAGRVLASLNQDAAAVRSYLGAVKAAEASQHPVLILEALIEIGAGLAKLDLGRSRQLLRMALQLAENIRSTPAQGKARQLLAELDEKEQRNKKSARSNGVVAPPCPAAAEARSADFSPLPSTSLLPIAAPPCYPWVSIVIPTFNNLELTQQCLEAVARNTRTAHEIIVVDNASADGTREFLRQQQAAGRLRAILNEENIGFAHACNQGARAAEAQLVLFLNNDTVPQPGWLQPLVEVLASDASAGAAGSKLLYPDGTIQHAGIVICNDQKAQDPLLARLLYRGEPGDLKDANTARQFQSLTAACILVRKSAFFLVGGFDEGYWNGYEDVDLCFKLRERNWKLVYQPASVVIHHESKSGPERFAKAQQNILRLHQKWLGKIQPDLVVKQDGQVVMAEDSILTNTQTARNIGGVRPSPGAATLRRELASESATTPDNARLAVAEDGHTPLNCHSHRMGKGAEANASPKVSIILLTLDNLSFTCHCLESIQNHTAAEDYELIVVDNASSDGTVEYLRQLQPYHANLRVIANRANRGFAVGNNQGISIARGRTVLLLNNDTVLTAGWLDRMLAVLDRHPEAGLVGPVSNCVSGPQLVCEASYKNLEVMPGFAAQWARRMEGLSLEVTRLVGFCLLARRELIERIGGLDERFGSGNFEDDDFCLRALEAGFKARIAQEVFVHHAGSQTFKSAKINYRDVMMSNWRLFKAKWGLPADSPIEKGYRLPLCLAANEPLKIPLVNLELDHQPDAAKRWWQETASGAGVPPACHGRLAREAGFAQVKKRERNFEGETPAGGRRDTCPTTACVELPAVARLGSIQGASELLRKKKHAEAWTSAAQAIQIRPFHPPGYLLLAEIARAAGDFGQSRRCAERASQLAPNWKQARKFLKALPGSAKKVEFAWTPLPEIASPPRLSVCLIVRNEEKFLGRCLDSVRDIAWQIIVVDTGSTDRTVEIARQHGAEVHAYEWSDDFSAARNAALEHATGDWVLILDADEELFPESRAVLKKEIQSPEVIACRLPIVDAGKEEEGCSYVPRLFRNAPGLFFVGRVHEQIFSSIEVRRQEWGLENRLGRAALRHHGYSAEVIQERSKNERNLALLQKATEEMPDEPNLLMNYGLELVRAGNLDGGLGQYWKAFRSLSSLPGSQIIPELRETLLTQLSNHLLKKQDFGAVAELMESPLARTGGVTASLHFAHGLALMELKQFSGGAAQMCQCLAKRGQPALSPINKEILKSGPNHCLALCLKMMEQPAQAAKVFAEAIQEEPGSSILRFDFARFLADQGQPVEALQMLHQVIADKPGELGAWLLGGEIALKRPEFLEFARDWTGEAIKYFPAHRLVALQRAEAALLIGDIESARPVWRQSHDSSNPRQLAAHFLCELLNDDECSIPLVQEPAVSQEFLKWYRSLLGAGAASPVGALHARLDKLRSTLPSACGIIEKALAEADHETSVPAP